MVCIIDDNVGVGSPYILKDPSFLIGESLYLIEDNENIYNFLAGTKQVICHEKAENRPRMMGAYRPQCEVDGKLTVQICFICLSFKTRLNPPTFFSK